MTYPDPWLRTENKKFFPWIDPEPELNFKNDPCSPNSPEFLEEITKPDVVYDVIYNVFFYEDWMYVNDFIRNTFKFNRNNKYLIVAHLSHDLYINYRHKLLRLNLLINPVNYNKQVFTWQLTCARFENFQYVKNLKIKFSHMMITVGTARFIRQVPYFPPWNEENTKPFPKYGYRVHSDMLRGTNGCIYTWAEENTENNELLPQNQKFDYKPENYAIGIYPWLQLPYKIYKNFIIPFFNEKGIYVSVELINTWMASYKMWEQMEDWFYNQGMYLNLKENDPHFKNLGNLPLDEMLFPSVTRSFNFAYCQLYNNRPYCCFPQGPDKVFTKLKIAHHNSFWQTNWNNSKHVLEMADDSEFYMYKKIPKNHNSPQYKDLHSKLSLMYNISDQKLLELNKNKTFTVSLIQNIIEEKQRKAQEEEEEKQRKTQEEEENIILQTYKLVKGQKCKNENCSFEANTTLIFFKKTHPKFYGLCCQKCTGSGAHGPRCTRIISETSKKLAIEKAKRLAKEEKIKEEEKLLKEFGLVRGQKCTHPDCDFLANTSERYLKGAHSKFHGLCCQKCRGRNGPHGPRCTRCENLSDNEDSDFED